LAIDASGQFFARQGQVGDEMPASGLDQKFTRLNTNESI
jgi:hypothetical protein